MTASLLAYRPWHCVAGFLIKLVMFCRVQSAAGNTEAVKAGSGEDQLAAFQESGQLPNSKSLSTTVYESSYLHIFCSNISKLRMESCVVAPPVPGQDREGALALVAILSIVAIVAVVVKTRSKQGNPTSRV